MPKYAGVNVEHPDIKATIKNMVVQGKKNEEIAKVVGMPHEVIERYRRETKVKKS